MQPDDSHIFIELKYCERCGELWFRECGSYASLCGPCTTQEPRVAQRFSERNKEEDDKRWFGPMTETVKTLQGVALASGRPS